MNNRLISLSRYLNSIYLKKESLEINLLIKEAASKLNALKRLGFSEETAKEIDDICKGFSMWIAYRVIDHVSKSELGLSEKNEIIKYLNRNFRRYRPQVSYIMDWVKVGLAGDYKDYKETSFEDLYKLADEWHDSLDVGDGAINYQEQNKIILDFREPDGTGYYWADLNTNRSQEECDRMGHCGTTSYSNNLFSLRRYIPIERRFTLNKSVLTAAVTSDGKIAQLKGSKNSKPEPEYHQYIIALLNLKKENEEGEELPVITGFRSEYDAKSDFSLGDLSDEQFLELTKTNPALFTSLAGRIIMSRRLNDPSLVGDTNGEFILTKSLLNEIIKTNRNELSTDSILDIINDPFILFSWYEAYASSEDIKYVLSDIDDINKNKIIELYKAEFANSEININNFVQEIRDNFRDFADTDIANQIRSAINTATENAAYEKITGGLIDTLESFGDARIEDGNLYLKINIYEIIKSINSDEENVALNILEEINTGSSTNQNQIAEDFFERMVEEGIIGSERMFFNLHYVPYNKNEFNDILRDYLGNI